MSAGRPQSAMAAWMVALSKSDRAEAKLLTRVFRRSRKAPLRQRKKKASSWTYTAGLSLRTHRSTADLTLGAGRNFSRGTSKRYSVSI